MFVVPAFGVAMNGLEFRNNVPFMNRSTVFLDLHRDIFIGNEVGNAALLLGDIRSHARQQLCNWVFC
jgi:hypothetical protein